MSWRVANECADRRFGGYRAPSVHGDAVRSRLALHREGHADLRPPARPEALLQAGSEPKSNGISEAFGETLKRDYATTSR